MDLYSIFSTLSISMMSHAILDLDTFLQKMKCDNSLTPVEFTTLNYVSYFRKKITHRVMEWPGECSILYQLGNEHLASLESCLSDAIYILKPMATIYYHLSFSQNVCTQGRKSLFNNRAK